MAATQLPAHEAMARPRDLAVPFAMTTLDHPTTAQTVRIKQIERRPTTAAATLVRIDTAAMRRRAARGLRPGGPTSTRGDTAIVVHGGKVTATIRSGSAMYRIEPVGGGAHALVKVDEAGFPPEHPVGGSGFVHGHIAGSRRLQRAKQGAGPVDIDVLVAYTPSAAQAANDIVGLIELAVLEANQSYHNSGIEIRLNLVDNFQLSYSEGSKPFKAMVSDFAKNATVKARRDNAAADVAVLIVNRSDSCGQANALMADAATAFAVVHFDCATGKYSFAHEIGHLQGATHEIDGMVQAAFPYGHGFINDRRRPAWRTIMAYDCANSCPRLKYWSSPRIRYGGVPMGTAGRNDNARVLNETATTVAAFRSRPAGRP
jgi:hypothetical protein